MKHTGAKQFCFDWDRADRDRIIDEADLLSGQGQASRQLMVAMLRILNGFISAKHPECWASQATLAVKLGVRSPGAHPESEEGIRTVRRVIRALEELSLVIQIRRVPRGGKKPVCHYRIVWSELFLLNSRRRRALGVEPECELEPHTTARTDIEAWEAEPAHELEPHTTVQTGPIDPTEQPDNFVEQPDNLVEQPDNYDRATGHHVRQPSTNLVNLHSPPLAREPALEPEPHTAEQTERERVVSELRSLRMSEGGIRRCLADAAQRGATLADIGGLIERYRREKPKCPAMHVGWLNRWISGESTPPDGELAPKPSARARDPSLAFEVERGRLVKRARALGVPESEIESACEQLRERLMGELADA